MPVLRVIILWHQHQPFYKDLVSGEYRLPWVHMIGRYHRYRELWERFRGSGNTPERAEKYFQPQDFTDLQVLSQIAWFDEFFLQDQDVAALIQKGRNYSLDDQRFVIIHQRELLAKVLP